MDPLPLLFAALTLSLIMALAWGIQRLTGQSGWIDTIWSFSVGIVGLGMVLSVGHGLRQIVICALVGLWSLRLGLHIAKRTHGAGDDPRYAQMMKAWGKAAGLNLFIFLQTQGLAALVLVLCLYFSALKADSFGTIQDYLSCGLILMALMGEAIADAQMAKFATAHRGQGKVCDTGLWALSRHPNYFFEWLMWCGWAWLGLDLSGHNPLSLLVLAAPLMIYWLLVHVSGIPPLEAHMMQSRPEAYRAYRAHVSAFFPKWPRTKPKK